MGVHANLTATRYPAQGAFLGARVRVAFHYDTAGLAPGEIVRDDVEPPHETVIRLDDGRVVRGAECQWMLERTAARLVPPP